MRKNFYYRPQKWSWSLLSWDIKVQLVVIASFLIAIVIAYIAINLVYA